MKASIIIPTYNKLPRLKLTLASIYTQTYPKNAFEVIVIDDGSTDGTREYLENLKADIHIRYFGQRNSGRAAARNLGIAKALGDILLFIDDDMLLSPHYIETHLTIQQTYNRIVHGKILALPFLKFFKNPSTGEMYNGYGKSLQGLRRNCITENDIYSKFEQSVMFRAKEPCLETIIREIMTDNALHDKWIGFTGGNVSLPRNWMISIEGFDENFGIKWGCEDIEAGYRLWIRGYQFFYSNVAVNYHMSHYRENYKEEHLQTTRYFYNKHNEEKILVFQAFVEGKITKEELLRILKE